jgi:hypothetical protein
MALLAMVFTIRRNAQRETDITWLEVIKSVCRHDLLTVVYTHTCRSEKMATLEK